MFYMFSCNTIPGVVMSVWHPTAAAHLIIEPIFPGSLILSQMIVNGNCLVRFSRLDFGLLFMSNTP